MTQIVMISEPLLKHSGEFDILSWCWGKTKEYPILTKIARDVMAVQVSIVASESTFSVGGRVLICTGAVLVPTWLRI
jgi:hypothetical protein